MDPVTITATIDGFAIEVMSYRVVTAPFVFDLPDNNLFPAVGCADVLEGTYQPVVADGISVIIKPMAIGDHFVNASKATFSEMLP